ncbi:MAG: phospholipase D-like domain-containing protein [Dokdonella sp.]
MTIVLEAEPNARQSKQWLKTFTEGDELYDAMLSDIRAADSNVRMESYIFADDQAGAPFFTALAEATSAERAVTVRVDWVGSWGEITRARLRLLKSKGIIWQWSRPWVWQTPLVFNRRNHRKLLIIDDRVAYVGGFNIHQESSRRVVGARRWRDTHVRFTGPLVRDAITLFDRFPRRPHVRWADFPRGTHLLPNNSRRCRHLLRCAFIDRFRAARERIWLTTPYFVPDSRSQSELCDAARRGIDVRVLVPAKGDVGLAAWATHAAYAGMLEAGVRIWEYLPRVLHAKNALVDREWSTVGTANFDYRSFFLNDELNLVVDEAGFNAELAAQFEIDLLEAREVISNTWRKRAWSGVITETIGWWARRWL